MKDASRCNSTYRLRYWNYQDSWPNVCALLSVATALTVYGIETYEIMKNLSSDEHATLQQHLPFTVLKPNKIKLTAAISIPLQQHLPFTVLKLPPNWNLLAKASILGCNSTYRLRYWNTAIYFYIVQTISWLQQHLPFTVLKLVFSVDNFHDDILLQQHLPFTVLKQYMRHNHNEINIVEHVLQQHLPFTVLKLQ